MDTPKRNRYIWVLYYDHDGSENARAHVDDCFKAIHSALDTHLNAPEIQEYDLLFDMKEDVSEEYNNDQV